MKKDKKEPIKGQEHDPEQAVTTEPAPETVQPEVETVDPLMAELESLKNAAADQEEKYLRLAAEYDNYRKRTQKEKENAWSDAKADTAAAFFPVYDNLERALKVETADEAYKAGVSMIMTGLKETFGKLGITETPALGQPFDANLHNAVMHEENPDAGENTITDVFQTGFMLGDKVVRFAMVKVAN
ncbi:MAG: nucleotide exchange factor GrpE [Oscillospiraceae bacterium]